MYICENVGDYIGKGESIELAYKDYKDNGGDEQPTELAWYEAVKIEIVVSITKKPMKTINKESK